MGVLRTAELAKPRVLRPNGSVIEPRRNGMRQLDVACLILQHVRSSALQDPGAAAGESRGVASRRDPVASGFDADKPHRTIVEEAIEHADPIAAAAHARNDD